MIAHGDRMLLAWQSSQMAMKDQEDGAPPMLPERPFAGVMGWEIDRGCDVADFRSHDGSLAEALRQRASDPTVVDRSTHTARAVVAGAGECPR